MNVRMWGFFTACILSASVAFASTPIEYKTVTGQGSGATRADAIREALSDAVGQVNGVQIASQKRNLISTASSGIDIVSGDSSLSAETHSYAEQQSNDIATATEGLIQNYSVLTEEMSPTVQGYINVTVEATITKYKAALQANRKRLAVFPLRLRANTQAERDFANLYNQELVTLFSATRRFAVVDRDFVEERNAEFALLQDQDAPKDELVRMGQTLGADFVLVGAINSFDVRTFTRPIPYTTAVEKGSTVDATISWRIVELATGQAQKASIEKIDKELQGENGLEWLASTLAESITKKTIETIYPLMPLAFSANEVTIGQGGETMQVGTRYTLVQLGEVLFDPYTKEPLARDEKEVGVLEIIRVQPKLSFARVVDSKVSLEGFEPRSFILRPYRQEQAKPAQKAIIKTQQPAW